MNLVCGTSKVREKTDLGAWGRTHAQPGDWGRLAVSPRLKRSGRRPTLERGGALDYLLVKGLDLGLHIKF